MALTGLGVLASSALFTSTASSPDNTLSTGTVVLTTSVDGPPATYVVTAAGMAPGDIVTGPVTITNSGSLQLRYAMLSTSDSSDANVLAVQLAMTVKHGVTSCTTEGFGASGTTLYGPGAFGSTTGTPVFGSATTGAQTGDRTLSPSANEVLCVQVSLPSSTPDSFQGRSTSAVFRFDAEQTTNNP